MKHYTKTGARYSVSSIENTVFLEGSAVPGQFTPNEARHLAYLLLAESYKIDSLALSPLMTSEKRDSGGLARSTGVSCSVAGCVVDHTKQPPMVCKRCGSLFTARGGSWEHEHGGYCLYCEAESRSS